MSKTHLTSSHVAYLRNFTSKNFILKTLIKVFKISKTEHLKNQKYILSFKTSGCRKCQTCLNGKYHFCRKNFAVGVKRDGGFARHAIVPSK